MKTDKPVVALTFDCCETRKPAGYDKKIVAILVKSKTPATFFLGGRWIETHPGPTRYLASVPFFELGNHSYIHPHMTRIPLARVRDELVRTQHILYAHTGRYARFFRPPYGEWNKTVLDEAAKAGMDLVTWRVVTGDPDPHVTAADILGAVHRARPGDVIIMHANGRGWHTAEALPRIVSYLKTRGLRPVTMSDLLRAGRPQWVTH